ncbi:unnamed protein product [Cylindrotheca closterium]|uniref:FAD/NAD(P)-binding domain-containing protein n=1 Tax=Cylindrotheca closterium TaxID=2856 RepID=A0AAD2GBE0_9STRA|nr:unnamed protein product [Cylindrotheca closterium]
MSDPKPKRIVVVGAGASARIVIKLLKKTSGDNVDITVVQPNTFASLPFYQTLVLTDRETLVGNSTFAEIEGVNKTVYGTAVGCSDGQVAVQPLDKSKSVETVPFDTLVCATGFAFPVVCETPGQSQAERQAEIDQYAKVLTSGQNVVVGGGGSVGVELAADILEKLPADSRKGKVTLICSSPKLLASQADRYGEKCKEVLEELGAEIIFNDRVSSQNDSIVSEGAPITLTLKSGKTLSCNAYVAAYARGANTSWLTTAAPGGSPLPEGLLNEKGQVIVNEYMQSAAYDKLYAMAATSDRAEPSLFPNVESQAATVTKNIVKPNSTKQAPGVPNAMYQLVGHDTFGTAMPENTPLPPVCATLCCTWCGFPCNMLCPCFCLGVLFGPCDPMVCGMCCAHPEGKGLANTLKGTKDMKMMAANAGYHVKGKPGFGEEMERS